MFIIEGPDLVGKTTLAKTLVKKLNEAGWPHVYQHLSLLPECWRQDVVANYRRLMSPYVVQDRFHYSEPLYASMREDPPLLSPSSYAQVERELRGFSSFLVVITAEPELIEQRYESSTQMYKLEQVLRVNDMYKEAARHGRFGAYSMPCDLWLHCTPEQPTAEIGKMLSLVTYLSRLSEVFPYASAERRIA